MQTKFTKGMSQGKRPAIFLTRRLPEEVMTRLAEKFELHHNLFNRPLSREEILKGVKNADGLISMLSDRVSRELIDAAPNLTIIANYAVGVNNIDLSAAAERNIAVTNTPGVLTESTADLTWGLVLSVARRLYEAERLARSGKWGGWAPTQLVGGDVFGKTLGLIGMGRIGQAVARRARGFSMEILYHSRRRLPMKQERELGITFVSLNRLLTRSDFVSLHLPLTEDSYHLINGEALRRMKPTAFLINTARGAVVDERALIRALDEKVIAGCGLDVFEKEPFISSRLRKMKQVALLPHIGSASRETRIRMGLMVFENLSDFFRGKRPKSMIN